jgi:hypothetical protein
MGINATELHLFIGRMVRVIYNDPEKTQMTDEGVRHDDMITSAAMLKDYNPGTQEVTLEYPGQVMRKIIPLEVQLAE